MRTNCKNCGALIVDGACQYCGTSTKAAQKQQRPVNTNGKPEEHQSPLCGNYIHPSEKCFDICVASKRCNMAKPFRNAYLEKRTALTRRRWKRKPKPTLMEQRQQYLDLVRSTVKGKDVCPCCGESKPITIDQYLEGKKGVWRGFGCRRINTKKSNIEATWYCTACGYKWESEPYEGDIRFNLKREEIFDE